MDAKERVQNELEEVKVRMDKLDSFILDNEAFNGLLGIQKGLLIAQSQAMNTYATILELRLENWAEQASQHEII